VWRSICFLPLKTHALLRLEDFSTSGTARKHSFQNPGIGKKKGWKRKEEEEF